MRQPLTDFSTNGAPCEIYPSHDFNDFVAALSALTERYAPQDVYALVDVDYTLTVPAHPATHAPNIKVHYPNFLELTQGFSATDIEKFENLVLVQQPQRVIDPKIQAYLAHLKKNHIKTTAITAMLCGGLDPYTTSLTEWRYESLKSLKIDFSTSFPELEALTLTQIPPYLNEHPQYYKGILCTNGEMGQHNKGTVLETFLNHIQYYPKVVVMIDDKLKNLEDVQQILKNSNIRFIGLDYQAGLHFAPDSIGLLAFTQFWTNIKNELYSFNG